MPSLDRLAVLTTGRQDYGILRSTILLLREAPDIRADVWAGGMHLDPRYGIPCSAFHDDGIVPAQTLGFSCGGDVVKDLASAVAVIGDVLHTTRPDALFLVGDRTETLAAAMAATVQGIPIVHLHGGEESEGAIDNVCRHAITKLSHLHLVSHSVHAARVIQMGEAPETVVVVGAPGLDHLYRDDIPSSDDILRGLGLDPLAPLVLVTVHPETLGEHPEHLVQAVATAMEAVPAVSYVVTAPNSDQGGDVIREYWDRWAVTRSHVAIVDTLGALRYWSLLRRACAVLGNSSSGIIEAPAAGVAVINVGDRQAGRHQYGYVMNVAANTSAITEALYTVLRQGRPTVPTDAGYAAGPVAPRIIAALRQWRVPRPPRKAFRQILCTT